MIADVDWALTDDDLAVVVRVASGIVRTATHVAPDDRLPPIEFARVVHALGGDDRSATRAVLAAIAAIHPVAAGRALASAQWREMTSPIPEWVPLLEGAKLVGVALWNEVAGMRGAVADLGVGDHVVRVSALVVDEPRELIDSDVTTRGVGCLPLQPAGRDEEGEVDAVLANDVLLDAVELADVDGHGPVGALPLVEWALRIRSWEN